MKLGRYFLLLVMFLAAFAFTLMAVTIHSHSVIFYATEVGLVVAIVFLILFYRKTIRPINTLISGMELLRDQDMSTLLVPSGQQETDEIVKTFNALLKRLRDEHLKLDEQNIFLNRLIEASPMGVVQCDLSGNITSMNPAAQKALTPLLMESLKALPTDTETTVRLSDSQIYRLSHLTFFDRGYRHPFYLIESLTSEVIKAEKAAYEKVIRMIAHEVNNNVAGIASTLDTLQDDVSQALKERTLAMSAFITQFANVVRIPDPQLMLCDLNEEVEAARVFLESLCGTADVCLMLQLTDEATPVHLDTTLFQQVLVNIVKNAVESIGSHGTIWIETRPKMLIVTDNGRGISPETARHLFTPFYSTKAQGQGLGLLLIRDILTKHGCTFTLLTDPDDGLTRFSIIFPEKLS